MRHKDFRLPQTLKYYAAETLKKYIGNAFSIGIIVLINFVLIFRCNKKKKIKYTVHTVSFYSIVSNTQIVQTEPIYEMTVPLKNESAPYS